MFEIHALLISRRKKLRHPDINLCLFAACGSSFRFPIGDDLSAKEGRRSLGFLRRLEGYLGIPFMSQQGSISLSCLGFPLAQMS